jgi:hypothetical protein
MYHKVQCDDKHWEYTILWKLPLWSNWLRRPTHNRYDTGSSPVGGTKYFGDVAEWSKAIIYQLIDKYCHIGEVYDM